MFCGERRGGGEPLCYGLLRLRWKSSVWVLKRDGVNTRGTWTLAHVSNFGGWEGRGQLPARCPRRNLDVQMSVVIQVSNIRTLPSIGSRITKAQIINER